MTDAPTRVAVQRWHHWVPGAAVAVMAAAATLLPGLLRPCLKSEWLPRHPARRYSFLKVTSADYLLNSHFFCPDRISKTLVPVLKGNGTRHFPTGSEKARSSG